MNQCSSITSEGLALLRVKFHSPTVAYSDHGTQTCEPMPTAALPGAGRKSPLAGATSGALAAIVPAPAGRGAAAGPGPETALGRRHGRRFGCHNADISYLRLQALQRGAHLFQRRIDH